MILLTLGIAFSIDIEWIEIGGRPLRMRLTPIGLLVVDSLGGRVVSPENFEITGLSFPVWADYCCGRVYVTDLKKSRVIAWRDGKIVGEAFVKRPEMIVARNGKIFVTDESRVHVFDRDLKKLKTFEFPSESVYINVSAGRLVHLEYWGNHPDVTFVGLESFERTTLDLGLERPFRYLEIDGTVVILDYMGRLAIRWGGKWKILRIGRYSYGLASDGRRVFTSSLVEGGIRVFDLEGQRRSFWKLPSPAGDVDFCCGRVVACGIFSDEVYVVRDGKIEKRIRGCDYPLMITSDPPVVYVLCSDSGKVLRIDFSK